MNQNFPFGQFSAENRLIFQREAPSGQSSSSERPEVSTVDSASESNQQSSDEIEKSRPVQQEVATKNEIAEQQRNEEDVAIVEEKIDSVADTSSSSTTETPAVVAEKEDEKENIFAGKTMEEMVATMLQNIMDRINEWFEEGKAFFASLTDSLNGITQKDPEKELEKVSGDIAKVKEDLKKLDPSKKGSSEEALLQGALTRLEERKNALEKQIAALKKESVDKSKEGADEQKEEGRKQLESLLKKNGIEGAAVELNQPKDKWGIRIPLDDNQERRMQSIRTLLHPVQEPTAQQELFNGKKTVLLQVDATKENLERIEEIASSTYAEASTDRRTL